jgi:hypothetical protein
MRSPAGLADVSYRVRFEGAALVQLNGLPAAAFDALNFYSDDLAETIRIFEITRIG